MTEEQRQEATYLTNLVLEASKWRLDESDQRDSIRIEVEHRLKVLMGEEDVPDEDGDIHDCTADEPSINNLSTQKIKPSRVGMIQITLPGRKKKWVKLDWTEEVSCKCSRTGFRRVVKPEYQALVPGSELIPNVDLGGV